MQPVASVPMPEAPSETSHAAGAKSADAAKAADGAASPFEALLAAAVQIATGQRQAGPVKLPVAPKDNGAVPGQEGDAHSEGGSSGDMAKSAIGGTETSPPGAAAGQVVSGDSSSPAADADGAAQAALGRQPLKSGTSVSGAPRERASEKSETGDSAPTSAPVESLSLFQAAYAAYVWISGQATRANAAASPSGAGASTNGPGVAQNGSGAQSGVQGGVTRSATPTTAGIDGVPSTSQPDLLSDVRVLELVVNGSDGAVADAGTPAKPRAEPADASAPGVTRRQARQDDAVTSPASTGASDRGPERAASDPDTKPVTPANSAPPAQAAAQAASLPATPHLADAPAAAAPVRVVALPPEPPAVRSDRVSVQLPDEAGGARIQVAVRGGSVEARIISSDTALASRLEAGLPELEGALGRQGFDDVRVSLPSTRSTSEPAAAAWIPTAAGAVSDARQRGSSDTDRRSTPEDRSNPYGDRRDDGRPNQRSRRERER